MVRLATLARPVPGRQLGDLPLRHLRIAEVADRVEAAALPFRTVEAGGKVLGQIDARAVIDLLIGRALR